MNKPCEDRCEICHFWRRNTMPGGGHMEKGVCYAMPETHLRDASDPGCVYYCTGTHAPHLHDL